MGNSTCLNVELTGIEGLIVERQTGSQFGHLLFNVTPFLVNMVIAHNFGVSGPLWQVICTLGECVEFVS